MTPKELVNQRQLAEVLGVSNNAISKAIHKGTKRLAPAVIQVKGGRLLDLEKALACWHRRDESQYPETTTSKAKTANFKALDAEWDEEALRARLIKRDDLLQGHDQVKAQFHDMLTGLKQDLDAVDKSGSVPELAARIQQLVKSALTRLADQVDAGGDHLTARNIARGIRPAEVLSIAEWAKTYRMLQPVEGPRPGPYNIAWVPYLRGIFEAFDDPRVRRIAAKKCSQSALTTGWLNVVGRAIHQLPTNIVYVLQNQANLRKLKSQKFDPLLSNHCLKNRTTDQSQERITFPGGMISFVSAESPSAFSGFTAQVILFDECDGVGDDVGGEGDPGPLIEVRATAYADRKIVYFSSPRQAETSRIDREYEDSDQSKYHVPCPSCGHLQELIFENFQWEKGKPDTICYPCQGLGCDFKIREEHKFAILNAGQWISTYPDRVTHRGFWIPCWYLLSGYTWEDMAAEYDAIGDNVARLIVFRNTRMGLSFRANSKTQTWETLYKRRSTQYQTGEIPESVLMLTAGIDVQGINETTSRLVCDIWGWTANRQRYFIERKVFRGDLSDWQNQPFQDLAQFLQTRYRHPYGGELEIEAPVIDTGNNTHTIALWCADHPEVYPIKGHATQPAIITESGNQNSVVKSTGARLFIMGTNLLKQELYSNLSLQANSDGTFPNGYLHFPADVEPAWLKELVSETLTKKGWKASGRNEAVDNANMARAGFVELGGDVMTPADWARRAEQLKTPSRPSVPAPPPVDDYFSYRLAT